MESKKKRYVGRIITIILLAVIVGACVAVYVAFQHYYGKSNYVSDESFTIYYGEFPPQTAAAPAEPVTECETKELESTVENQEPSKEPVTGEEPGTLEAGKTEEEPAPLKESAAQEDPELPEESVTGEEPGTLEAGGTEDKLNTLKESAAQEDPELPEESVTGEEPGTLEAGETEEEPAPLKESAVQEDPELPEESVTRDEWELIEAAVTEDGPESLTASATEEGPSSSEVTAAEVEPSVAAETSLTSVTAESETAEAETAESEAAEADTAEAETAEIKTSAPETGAPETSELETAEMQTTEAPTPAPETEATLASSDEEELRREHEAVALALQQAKEKYVYNLLLIGADSRGGWYGNSDAMILLSINTKTKKMFMTSFMRDLYADIPQIGVRKLNSAYARGAGPLLVATIESNYRIDINNYASVDFSSMSGIIDLLGGVDLQVSTAEAEVMRIYIEEMAKLYGLDPEQYYITGGGVTHLNGIQAVSYARVRYVGNADYERTSRQRRVLEQLIVKARSMDTATMLNVVNQVLPLVTHNIDPAQVVSLLAGLPDYLNYEVIMDRIPYDGAYGHMGEILVPDFDYTINRLQATIYEGIYAEQMPESLPAAESGQEPVNEPQELPETGRFRILERPPLLNWMKDPADVAWLTGRAERLSVLFGKAADF